MSRTRPTTSVPPNPGTARVWPVLLASCVGQFLVVLDVSVVNVALPGIRDDLDLSAAGLQWVVNAYALTFAGFLLLGGRASDLFGRKPVYLAGLGLFTASSLAGGLAGGGGALIAARTAQGVGAAVLAPVTLSLITATLPEGRARTRAIAAWTATGAAGGAAGGLIGGALTDWASWRWVLLINVPVGLLVGALVLVALREPGNGRAARPALDLPGAALVTGGVAALAYGITGTETAGWSSPETLVPLLGGPVALAAFVAVEARGRDPLMPPRLFRVRSVAVGNLITLIAMTGSFAMWYFLTLYMQNVLGYSAVETGLAFLPHTAGVITGSQLAPALMARFGGRSMVVAGGVLMAAGFLWQGAVLAEGGGYVATVALPALPMAAGVGLMLTPLTETATAGAPPADAGAVAGLINTSRQIGAVLGLSLLSAAATSGTPAEGYARAFLAGGVLIATSLLLVPLLPPRTRPGGPGGCG
ncbi:MFS transporter [Streptomyces sp. DSM 44917]|uniref:MFS transporter n=2 Tax=Streptomyces boetiae TaxID=3075541 RepID=A0ABU2L993_9ACTN|nr:MFS transporter [Streptomyces sp. DSM 44917]MDT0308140.1 MFS transporter [Streptomyces sp. DSM 44917]